MKKISTAIFSLSFLMCSCDQDVLSVPEHRANLRVINLINGIPQVKITQSNSSLNEKFSFGEKNRYFSVLSGQSLQFDLSHPDSSKRFTFLQYTFAQDGNYTVFLSGKYPQQLATPLIDILTQIRDTARVRFSHFSESGPDISFFLAKGQDTIPAQYFGGADMLGYGESTQYNNFSAGNYSLIVKDDEGLVINRIENFSLESGASYSTFLYDSANVTKVNFVKDSK